MKPRPQRSTKRRIANFFGAFGYFFSVFLWFWAVMLYFSVIQPVVTFLSPPPAEQVEQSSGPMLSLPSPVELTIAVVVTVIMLALTIIVLIRMPLGLAKTGRKAVHKTTKTVVPIAIKVQHKKDTKKLRARLTTRILLVMKALMIIIPVVFVAASGLLEALPLDYLIAVTIGAGLAGLSLGSFALQYLLASIFRIASSELW